MKKETPFIPADVYYKGYSLDQALLSVKPGWHGLLREIYDKKNTLDSHIDIIQVKEKFGGLRVYTSSVHDEFDTFILENEIKSYTLCEECGDSGALRGGGWYQTLCDAHSNGREPINPF